MLALFLLLALLLVLVGHAFRLLRWEQFIRIYERPPRGQMLRGMAGLDEPFGRLFFQVELTPCHGFRKLCILLRVVTAHLEERDGRFTVPRS